MKKSILVLVVLLFTGMTTYISGQTSPDYIFGDDNGTAWSWVTGAAGTAGLGSTYKWQFAATATADHYFKFGEISSGADGSGFWINNAVGDLQYTGSGAMWNAYYYPNLSDGGAIYCAITTGNYYVIKTRKDPGNSNCNFAVFDNGAQAPVTVSSVTRTFSSPNLLINATLSGVKSANEKVWVRYTTDNWTTSSTTEASNNTSGNIWQASVALTSGQLIKYYVYTTIQQAVAPAEADADFFTINYNNNSGVNYTYMNGNMTGTYYIGNNGTRPGGGNPDFSFLAQACDALNSSTVSGNITVYFTSNTTEILNSGLGVNTNSFTITFKPSADEDRTITFMKTTDNAGPSGGFAIGISNILDWATLVQTDNVIIDGYADGGTTRRLIWKSDASAHYYTGPLSVVGNSNNIQIKNLIVQHDAVLSLAGNNTAAIAIRLRYVNPISYIPDNITIENCEINATSQTAANGIYLINSLTPSPVTYMTGIVIKNNIIRAKHRGIFINYVDGLQVEGNEIYVNQTANGMASIGLGGNSNVIGTINVIGNKLLQNSTANTSAGAYGIRAIQCSGGATGNWYVINNFITGFSTAATGTAEVVGIRVGVPTYAYNNTIIINDVSTTGPGTTPTCGIVAYTTTADIRNNIIITNEDNFANYCIYASSLPNTSNYNNLYRSGTTNAKIGFYSSARASLEDWQTGSGKDANSKSKLVNFVSTTDLHLTAPSIGDVDLIGTPLGAVLTDIDGETRSLTFPYMGADENLASPLPVELATFNALPSGQKVNLKWSTKTEVNSYQFVVERSLKSENGSQNSLWEKVGEVNASGNSNSPKEYSFTDKNLADGKYSYRLKMIDNDGTFEYSQVIEVEIDVPGTFALSQNYPNPFNPSTTINYQLPVNSQVKLVIYSITGEMVRTLVDENQVAGNYTVSFDASGLASGTYIYRLVAGDFVSTKKMVVLK